MQNQENAFASHLKKGRDEYNQRKCTTGVWKNAFNYSHVKFSNFLFSTIFPLCGALSKPIQSHVPFYNLTQYSLYIEFAP